MGLIVKFFNILCLCFLTISCSASNDIMQRPLPSQNSEPVSHSLGIIGAIEPIYILPMKTPFEARIDTGAEGSAIDVGYIKHFERDGEKWVAFTIKNEKNGEVHRFEKKVEKKLSIKRFRKNEKRTVVTLDVKFGNHIIQADFSLTNREKFDYQVLIGRNILTGRAIVDTSLSHTLN